MRHALYLFALIVTLALVPVDRAHAQYRFGTDEQIHFIEDVPLKGAKDEALYLGYMTPQVLPDLLGPALPGRKRGRSSPARIPQAP